MRCCSPTKTTSTAPLRPQVQRLIPFMRHSSNSRSKILSRISIAARCRPSARGRGAAAPARHGFVAVIHTAVCHGLPVNLHRRQPLYLRPFPFPPAVFVLAVGAARRCRRPPSTQPAWATCLLGFHLGEWSLRSPFCDRLLHTSWFFSSYMEVQEAGSCLSVQYKGWTSRTCHHYFWDRMASVVVGWFWHLLWCSHSSSLWQYWSYTNCQWSCETWAYKAYQCWCFLYSVSLSLENNCSSVCVFWIATGRFLH